MTPNQRGEPELRDIKQQLQEHPVWLAEEAARKLELKQRDELWRSATDGTPPDLHELLHAFLRRQFADPASSYHSTPSDPRDWDPKCFHCEFFGSLHAGLVGPVMYNLKKDDYDPVDRGRYGVCNMIPIELPVWPVVGHVLKHPELYPEHWWYLKVALKSAERCALQLDGNENVDSLGYLCAHSRRTPLQLDGPAVTEAVALLEMYLRRDGAAGEHLEQLANRAIEAGDERQDEWSSRELLEVREFVRDAPSYAALALATLAPATPGLPHVLMEMLETRREGGPYISGLHSWEGHAAWALRSLGSGGREALPRLRALIATWRPTISRAHFQAFAGLSSDPAEVEAMLQEFVARGWTREALVDSNPWTRR